MASCTTPTWGNANSPRLRLDVSIASQTDTTATLSWALYYVAPYALSSSVNKSYKAVVGGSTVASGTFSVGGKTGTHTIASGTKAVSKKSSAQTVSFSCSMDINAYWNSVYQGTISASGSISVAAITVYAPIAPSSVSHVRNSDAKNTLSWVSEADTTHPYSSLKVQRQVDGGAWSDLASVDVSATGYADSSTSANHRYAYRLVATNGKGSATSAASAATHNTPAAPTSVTASRLAETTVSLAIANPANTATALEIQRSADAAAWATVATVEGTVTAATDEPGGGTFYYRARNTRGSLVSAWSPASNAVVTITPPAAPTVASPASGAVIPADAASVAVSWLHNPIDGSAQTAAEVDYSTDGGASWATTAITGSAQSCELPNGFTANDYVSIRVRTRGAHEDFGPYSATRTFSIRQAPTTYFREPSGTIGNMPIDVDIAYSDVSGNLAQATLEILDASGATVYTRDLGTETAFSIEAADFLPENGQSYTLRATVRSSSSLSSSATSAIEIDFIEPMEAALLIVPDAETGFSTVVVTIVDDESKEPSDSVSVFRVANGERVPIAQGVHAGDSVIDRYAPLRTDYVYEAISFAESGAYSATAFDARIQTPYFFVYSGGIVAKAKANPSGAISVSRPSKRRVHYAGRRWPVSYDDMGNTAEQRNFSATLESKADADAFIDIMRNGGRCVYKSADGDVMHADVSVRLSPDYAAKTKYGAVELTLDRIDGEAL